MGHRQHQVAVFFTVCHYSLKGRAMTGDVIQTASELSGGKVDTDSVLKWLAEIVKSLRETKTVACGAVGDFVVTENLGTVEINPATKNPVPNYSRRILDFDPSDQLKAIVASDIISEEDLAALDSDDPVASCFGRALATILTAEKRATIGNFGTWTVTQRPDMQRFILFRPRPAINRML
jgi:nucleoid DNA-binding protein